MCVFMYDMCITGILTYIYTYMQGVYVCMYACLHVYMFVCLFICMHNSLCCCKIHAYTLVNGRLISFAGEIQKFQGSIYAYAMHACAFVYIKHARVYLCFCVWYDWYVHEFTNCVGLTMDCMHVWMFVWMYVYICMNVLGIYVCM